MKASRVNLGSKCTALPSNTSTKSYANSVLKRVNVIDMYSALCSAASCTSKQSLKAVLHVILSSTKSKRGVNCENPGSTCVSPHLVQLGEALAAVAAGAIRGIEEVGGGGSVEEGVEEGTPRGGTAEAKWRSLQLKSMEV